jgi:hypothetical protein
MFTNMPGHIPIAIRSHTKLGEGFEDRVRTQLARRIGPATFVKRATVRFEDVNGPKGGEDIICRIKLVVAGRPSIVVAKRATSEPLAFAEAVHAIGTTLARANQKRHAVKPDRLDAGGSTGRSNIASSIPSARYRVS